MRGSDIDPSTRLGHPSRPLDRHCILGLPDGPGWQGRKAGLGVDFLDQKINFLEVLNLNECPSAG
jgi:hypothetical protein